ncbi:MAG TPA: polysaccharide biosynthesis C-terminal domain-containing protein, partial [Planctomycetota bacterium]|nr:polysaccharide biosynthesis C-terminal domain-containing protein [Planctomycetota bacterium]
MGRGALYLSLSKLYFIVGSFGIYFGLRWAAASPTAAAKIFGDFKAVGAALSVLSTVLVTGTVQAISRFEANRPGGTRSLLGLALRVEVVLGCVIGGLYFLASGWLSARDPSLLVPLRISALIPLIYPLYAAFVGILNGQKRFFEQAVVDASFTTLKVLLVLLGVAMFQSAAGGYMGFALCAFLITALAAGLLARGGLRDSLPMPAPRASDILRFQSQTVLFMFLIQWIVHMDLWYVILWHQFPNDQLNDAKSLYGGTQLFAQLSYSLVIALTFVLFPLISRLDLSVSREKACNYVRRTLRYAAILVGGAVTVLSVHPPTPLSLLLSTSVVAHLDGVFPGQVLALPVLASGFACLALGFVILSAMNAADHAKRSIVAVAVGVAVHLALAPVLIGKWQLLGASIATGCGMLALLVMAVLLARAPLGFVLPIPTLLRVAVSAG